MPYQELCGALADAEAYLYEHNDSLNSARERQRESACVRAFGVCLFLFFCEGCPQEWGRHYCKLMLVQVVSDIFKLKERENRKG